MGVMQPTQLLRCATLAGARARARLCLRNHTFVPATGRINARSLGLTRPVASASTAPPGYDWLNTETYVRTRTPVQSAYTLPGAVYHDPALAALEQDRVWEASWVAAAERTDIGNHGDTTTAQIGASHTITLTNNRGSIQATLAETRTPDSSTTPTLDSSTTPTLKCDTALGQCTTHDNIAPSCLT